jgi:hypothetical protein
MYKKVELFIPDNLPTSVTCDDGKLCIDWELEGNIIYTMEITKDYVETTKFVNGKVESEETFKVKDLYAD